MSIFDFDKHYTKSEQQIMNYILEHTSAVCMMSITELSSLLHLSEATISRFCKHTGYEDFKNLKKSLSETVITYSPATKLASTLTDSSTDFISAHLEKQTLYLEQTLHTLDQTTLQEATLVVEQANHIYIHGKGASYALAHYLHFRLQRFFKQVTLLPSGGSELFEAIAHLTATDVVISFGFASISSETRVLLDYCKKISCKTILFTGQLYTKPNERGDFNLYVYRGALDEYHSMTSAMALLDLFILILGASPTLDGLTSLSHLHSIKENYKHILPR